MAARPTSRAPSLAAAWPVKSESFRPGFALLAAAGFAALILCPIFANEGLPDVAPGFLAPTEQAVREAGGLIIADEVQLRQIFQNLIGNAIKFRSETPPRIAVVKSSAAPPKSGVASSTRQPSASNAARATCR